MENDEKQTRENAMHGDENPTEDAYVRVDDNSLDEPSADATRLAQPVGESYEGETYMRAESAAPSAQDVQTESAAQAEGTPLYARAEASTGESSEAQSASSQGEAEHVQAEEVAPAVLAQEAAQAPKGKTKRVKSRGFGKFVAVLLLGAIIGGAAGGAVGYNLKSQSGTIQAVSTPRNAEEVSYDADGNMTVSSIANEAMPAVVSVYNIAERSSQNIFGFSQSQSGGSTAQGYGSGVLISSDGMIVTNYHVIEDSDSVVVVTSEGDQYQAEVLGTDSSLDLAVLKIDGSDFPYVDFADSDQVQVGDLAVAIGNPLGSEFANTVTDGIVSGIDRQISSEDGDIGYIQTNAAINNGNSGGALLNGQAQLIGINSLKVSSTSMYDVEGMGFAIPSNTVLEFVNSVKDGSNTNASTKAAWLGISGYSMNEEIAFQFGTNQETGVLVGSVTAGGPSESAGVQVGDIITAIDDTEVTSFEDLSGYLDGKQPGDEVTLSVLRNNATGEIKVTLGTQS